MDSHANHAHYLSKNGEKLCLMSIIFGCILLFKLFAGQTIITALSVCATWSGLDQSTKGALYDALHSVMMKIKNQDFPIPCGNWNGHIGQWAGFFLRILYGVLSLVKGT